MFSHFVKIFPAASTAKTNQTTGDPSLSPPLHLQYLRAPATITVKGRQQLHLPTSTETLWRNRVTERPPAAVLAVTTRGGQITTADRDTSREPPQFNRVPPGSYKHLFSYCIDDNHHFSLLSLCYKLQFRVIRILSMIPHPTSPFPSIYFRRLNFAAHSLH